ncbi:MAG: hypothetical protein IJG63_03435 [Oscillospiraceae bacterium]|nr:hypothetical protein [Oscillospiraceae bacterium]
MKNILIILLALAMVFVFAACDSSDDSSAEPAAQAETAGTDAAEAETADTDAAEADAAETDAAETDAAETTEAEEDDGYIDGEPYYPDVLGDWQDHVSGRASLTVTSEDENGYVMEVSWGSSAFERRVWNFTGIYDPDTETWSYSDCVCVDETADEGGNVTSETVFENGAGTMAWKIEDDKDVLIWHDEHSEYDWDNEFVRPEA